MHSALITFAVYLAFVFLLAWWSSLRRKNAGGFVSEYFLGRRNFGMWAFALSFAATSASGGSFMSFPGLIYAHGWVLAFWVSSYMLVPLVGMGLLGKRLNQVARRAKAVTIPELIEERFRNSAVGLTATLIVVVFMFFYLLAQFKAGAKILTTLLSDMPLFQSGVAGVRSLTENLPLLGNTQPDYLLCLVVFAVAVIVYVVYGGFRAVVWTDVMQGFVMFAGVVIMLVLVLSQVGGLGKATEKLKEMTPPEFGVAEIVWDAPAQGLTIPVDAWLRFEKTAIKTTEVIPIADGATGAEVAVIILTTPAEVTFSTDLPEGTRVTGLRNIERYARGAGETGVYVSAPGPHRKKAGGLLPLGLAFSMFVFWAFGATGQPANMVRLMAFKNTPTLRRAIVTVSIYYSVIYFSLVVIFCCGRVLLPGMDHDTDRVMPELAAHLTAAAGWPWLAGLLLAAPFAAVMSSVDSFLLMVSSSLVRDVYQRRMNPTANERTLRRLAHLVTALVGILAVLAIVNPPDSLQYIIIFASGGLAGCFLVPMFLALYWPRLNAAGMLAGMLGGFSSHLAISVFGFFKYGRFEATTFLGLEPFVWDLIVSLLVAVIVTLRTPPPKRDIVQKFFGRRSEESA